jgi:hypothetical protein
MRNTKTMRSTRAVLLIALSYCTAVPADPFCNERIEFSTPDSRFIDNEDGTVTDRLTSLQWQRCPLGFEFVDGDIPSTTVGDRCEPGEPVVYGWQAALLATQDLNAAGGFAGFQDWRMPNEKELVSIVEARCFAPAVNVNMFPDTPPDRFWSGGHNLDSDTAPVHVDFATGGKSTLPMNVEIYVRLVRPDTRAGQQ